MSLKKSDFLAVVTDEPMSRADIEAALTEFEYIPSWLDYLIDHFEAQNKIVRDEDTGLIQRKARTAAGGNPNEIFRVVYDEDFTPSIETRSNTGLLKPEDRECGYRATIKAAVRDANSELFKLHKERVAALKALIPADEPAPAQESLFE